MTGGLRSTGVAPLLYYYASADTVPKYGYVFPYTASSALSARPRERSPMFRQDYPSIPPLRRFLWNKSPPISHEYAWSFMTTILLDHRDLNLSPESSSGSADETEPSSPYGAYGSPAYHDIKSLLPTSPSLRPSSRTGKTAVRSISLRVSGRYPVIPRIILPVLMLLRDMRYTICSTVHA